MATQLGLLEKGETSAAHLLSAQEQTYIGVIVYASAVVVAVDLRCALFIAVLNVVGIKRH